MLGFYFYDRVVGNWDMIDIKFKMVRDYIYSIRKFCWVYLWFKIYVWVIFYWGFIEKKINCWNEEDLKFFRVFLILWVWYV